ncbi:ROK family transcriptional regulator [Sphingomonas sp. HMWF008]|nr:ROK family transcriptional regulator [Sphingomonas sp. HMWF008]
MMDVTNPKRDIQLAKTTHPAVPRFGRIVRRENDFRSLSGNERDLVREIRRNPSVSRAELARRTGLALPTVSRLVDQLIRDGLLVAEDKVMMSRTGQPSLPLSLAPHAAYAFGVAVRADAVTVALVHLSGRIVATRDAPAAGASRDGIVSLIAASIDRLADDSGVPSDRVCGLGMALPGFFVDDPVRINAPLGMEDWATADLEQDLSRVLGLPVIAENDGSAAALGEYLYGHGNTHPTFAYLYVDRGLGGGLVIDGKLLRGRRGNAGEFTGLLPPEARKDRPTLTGLKDLLETDGVLFESLGDMLNWVDPEAPAVSIWVERSVAATDAIISAIGAIMDPDAIVVGGRIPKRIAERLVARLGFFSVPVRGRDRTFPELLVSNVVGDAAALGAGALCFNSLFV